MKRTRLKPEARKTDILEAAVLLARETGYTNVTREQIAERVGVSGPAIQYHFGNMAQLRRDLMRRAVKAGDLAVIAQGLAAADPQARKADEGLQRRALDALVVGG